MKRQPFLKEQCDHVRAGSLVTHPWESFIRKSCKSRELIGNTVKCTLRHLGAHPDKVSNSASCLPFLVL